MLFFNRLQRFTLCLFLFSIPFEMWVPLESSELSFAKITAMIYFLSILPQLPQFIRTENVKSVLLPALFFFALLTSISIYNINEQFSEFFDMPIFLNIIIFGLLINHGRKDYMIIEKGMLFYLLGSVVLLMFFFAGIGVRYIGGRVSMFGDNQNQLGLKMAISSIILLLAVIQNRLKIGWYRYLFFIPLPFMLYFIGKTGSRSATIAIVLAIVSGVILYKTKTSINKVMVVLFGSIFVILMGVLLMQNETLTSRLKATSESGDLGERDKIWKAASAIIMENPIIGVGKTGYANEFTEIWGAVESPHNVIIEVLCYTGIIGLFIYFIFLYQVFSRAYNTYQLNGWLLPLLLIIPVMGHILSGQILESKSGWVILAYMVSSTAIKNQGQTKENLI